MSVTVELWYRNLAEVTFRPSLWRRLFLRQDTEIRYAARARDGGVWFWDGTGRAIEDDSIVEKLWRAVTEADDDRMKRDLARARRAHAEVDDVTAN